MIYVETEPGRFEIRRVSVGPMTDKEAVIIEGLARGETVATAVDALFTMVSAGLDALVLEDALVDRAALPSEWFDRLPAWRGPAKRLVSRDLYTF